MFCYSSASILKTHKWEGFPVKAKWSIWRTLSTKSKYKTAHNCQKWPLKACANWIKPDRKLRSIYYWNNSRDSNNNIRISAAFLGCSQSSFPVVVFPAYQSRDGCKTNKQTALLLEGANNLGWGAKSLFCQLKLIASVETLMVQCPVWGELWIIQRINSEILQMRVS